MLLNILLAIILFIRIVFGFLTINLVFLAPVYAKETHNDEIKLKEQPEGKEKILEGLGMMNWQDKYCGNYSNHSDVGRVSIPVRPRLSGARDSNYGEFPSAAMILANTTQCSAVIITNRHVLTAAHCVNGTDSSVIMLFVGHENYRYRQVYFIEKVCTHSNFAFLYYMYSYDLSVLKTDRNIEFKSDVQPACLPREVAYPFEPLYVVTYGHEPDLDSNNDTLMDVKYSKVLETNKVLCLRQDIHQSRFCVWPLAYGTSCKADVGGPLLGIRHGRQEVSGIVSFGPRNGCDTREQRLFGATDTFRLRTDIIELAEMCS